MVRRRLKLDRPPERRWSAVHPFRPRLSRRRRVFMTVLLLFFMSCIGVYVYITDSSRVKQMAESYLSHILGGPVEVGSAKLSIFEGLRLDHIQVHVDKIKGEDSIVFTADTFKIDYRAG